MKKLNLKLGSIKEMLSKEQMKKVVGGDSYYTGCTLVYLYPEYHEETYKCYTLNHYPDSNDIANCQEKCVQYNGNICVDCRQLPYWPL